MINVSSYAPVSYSAIDKRTLKRGYVRGFASPQQGPLPCAVKLVAGERILAVAEAIGFSEHACAEDVRLGWCGFEIGSLFVAIALDKHIEIRCAVSEEVIAGWSSEELLQQGGNKTMFMTVASFREHIKGLSGTSDYNEVEPFVEYHRQRYGDIAMVQALYKLCLGRDATAAEAGSLLNHLSPKWTAKSIWTHLVTSDEFMERIGFPLVGPFDPSFPFDVSPLS